MNCFKAWRLSVILGLQSVLLPLFLSAAVAAPDALIISSVKLRVDTGTGYSWGTGTIIDTRKGPEGQEALILTCGHIFKGHSPGKDNIEVHLFNGNSTVLALGKYLCHDLEMDLALVTIAPPHPVQAIPIAPASYSIHPTQQAWSVGCDHGGNPTIRQHQVMSVDKIFEQRKQGKLFYYVQVSGAPVSGRSGGGLFSADGYLIGVCNTGDPVANDGHFVPPHVIRYLLDQRDLAEVYVHPSLGKPEQAMGTSPARTLAQTPSAVGLTEHNSGISHQPSPPKPAPMALAALTPLEPMGTLPNHALPNIAPVAAVTAPMVAENRGGMSREERATLEEIERFKQDGDEIIVIRRPRNPTTPSDVIVLNGASDQFLNALVNSPPSSSSGYNPVIFSSHAQPVRTAERQQTSFSVGR